MRHVERFSRINPRSIRYGLLGALGVSLVFAMVGTRQWPLVGDAALMHYVVFLLRGGAIPYRQVVDINLPGTYLFESVGMAVFGTGAKGLRLYDWSLLACITVACVWLAGRRRWFAGLFAGLFFALIHIQDGVAQQGQRDLLMAALLLTGLACLRALFENTEHRCITALGFGLAFGASFTIKPVLLPLAAFLLILGISKAKALRSPLVLSLALLGLLLPGFVALCWLRQAGALSAFSTTLRLLLPLHAALSRKSLWFLFNRSFSPLGCLLLGGILLASFDRARFLNHKFLYGGSVVGTLIGYVVQGKGYPYQRYPLLVVLLVILGLIMDRALDKPGKPQQVALLMACWAACLGVFFAWRSTRFETRSPTISALSDKLQALGPLSLINGNVQCLDTFGGCVNTLYNLQIRQSTGYLYDCYLFSDVSAARTAYREQFWIEFQKARPRLVVISSQNCFKTLTDGYDRLASWPALDADLHEHYTEVARWAPTSPVSWSSQRQMQSSFKILIRTDPKLR